MKKASKSFLIVLIAVVILTIGLLVPTTNRMKENMGLNMGSNTTLVVSVKSNTDANVDYAKVKDIFTNRADLFKTNQYNMYLSDTGEVAVEVPRTSETAYIQTVLTETMNLEVRDVNDAVLLTADDLIKAEVTYSSTGSVLIQYTFNKEKLAEATAAVAAYETSTDRYLILWTDYASGDSYAAEKEKYTDDSTYSVKYLSEVTVSEENTTGKFTMAGITSELYSKQLASLINAGSADYTYTFVNKNSLGDYQALTISAYAIGFGSYLALAVFALFNYRRYNKTAIAIGTGVGFTLAVSLAFYVFSGGTLSIQSLVGLWTGILVLAVNHLYAIKRAKISAIKGRGVDAAIVSGYDAITKPALLSSVLLFVIGIVIYLVNIHFLRDFGMMLIITSLSNVLFGLFLTRALVIRTGKSSNNNPKVLGLSGKDYSSDAQQETLTKENALSKMGLKKPFKPVLLVLVVVLVVFGALASIKIINLIPDYNRSISLVVDSTSSEDYVSIQAKLTDAGFLNGQYSYEVGDTQSWYIFSETADKTKLNEISLDITSNMDVVSHVYDFVSVDKVDNNLMLTAIAVTMLLITLILFSFYSFAFSKTGFATALLSGAAVLAGASFIGGVSVEGLLISALALLITSAISFVMYSNLREDIKANKRLRTNKEAFDKLVYDTYANNADILVSLALLFGLLGLVVFALGNLSFIRILPMIVVAIIVVFAVSVFVQPNALVLTITLKDDDRKPKSKSKNKTKNEKEELTVIGVND